MAEVEVSKTEIALENVIKTYGKSTALNVSFKIKEGKSLGIVGESGCGKSTAANIAAGLITPTKGRCTYNGKDLKNLKRQESLEYRRNVQMVFQDYNAALNPRMTVGASIAEPIRNFIKPGKKEEKELAKQMLKQIGLTEMDADRYPRAFSGGQRQRICIARAIATSPKILLLDEVTSNLDVSVQAQILNLLADLKKSQGMGMLLISHDIGVVRYMCDKILVMYQGHVVEELDSENLKNAKHPYTKQLLASVPAI